jgi:hypothetical protein
MRTQEGEQRNRDENREAFLLDNAYRGAMEERRACNDATWYSHRDKDPQNVHSLRAGLGPTQCSYGYMGNGLADLSCIRGLRGALGDRTGASALGGGGPMGEGDWVQKVSHSSTEMPRLWMLS